MSCLWFAKQKPKEKQETPPPLVVPTNMQEWADMFVANTVLRKYVRGKYRCTTFNHRLTNHPRDMLLNLFQQLVDKYGIDCTCIHVLTDIDSYSMVCIIFEKHNMLKVLRDEMCSLRASDATIQRYQYLKRKQAAFQRQKRMMDITVVKQMTTKGLSVRKRFAKGIRMCTVFIHAPEYYNDAHILELWKVQTHDLHLQYSIKEMFWGGKYRITMFR